METQERVPFPPPPPATSGPAARDPPASADFLVEALDYTVAEQPLYDAKAKDRIEDSEPAAEGSPVTEDHAVSSGDASLDHALFDKIVWQVEYYFSDENFPKTFLLKLSRKDREGYVPITVISSFKKVKKITKDLSLIKAALRTSSLLVVSSDGKNVKRLLPFPVANVRDANAAKPHRTVFVENLPEDYSEDNIRRIFGTAGHILEVTIREVHSAEQVATLKKKKKNADLRLSDKLHAFVEYDTVEAAESAVSTLNDERNWRNGMRVELVVKRMAKYGPVKKRWKNVSLEKNTGAEALEMRKAPSASSSVEGGVSSKKPMPGPKMPDGTRGFTMGRGRPITT